MNSGLQIGGNLLPGERPEMNLVHSITVSRKPKHFNQLITATEYRDSSGRTISTASMYRTVA